jgi:hypothetical protein
LPGGAIELVNIRREMDHAVGALPGIKIDPRDWHRRWDLDLPPSALAGSTGEVSGFANAGGSQRY